MVISEKDHHLRIIILSEKLISHIKITYILNWIKFFLSPLGNGGGKNALKIHPTYYKR